VSRETRRSVRLQAAEAGHYVLRRTVGLAAALVLFAAPALAQAQGASARLDHPVLLVGGQYGAPTRLTGTAGLLIARPRPFESGTAPDSSRAGLVLTVGAGTGGVRVAAGAAALALEGPMLTTGLDALFTLSRTADSPRGATGGSTYIGGEVGLVIMSVRLSAGVARRTAGDPAPKATIFTWSVGVQLPLGW